MTTNELLIAALAFAGFLFTVNLFIYRSAVLEDEPIIEEYEKHYVDQDGKLKEYEHFS